MIPSECSFIDKGLDGKTNRYCRKCGGIIKLRYYGNDPETGPAVEDCSNFHIEQYKDRKWDVLSSNVEKMWEYLRRVAPQSTVTKSVQEQLNSIKF